MITAYLFVAIYIGSSTSTFGFIDRVDASLKTKRGNITAYSILRDASVLTLMLCALIFFLPAGIIEIFRISKVSLRQRKKRREIKERKKLGYLYHLNIGGAGILICKECGHREEIVSFLHGFDNGYSETGYQCPECGSHVPVVKDKNIGPNLICKCGGIFKRGDPLFCSQCRSKKLKYEFRMIT